MKERLLQYLICPTCKAALTLFRVAAREGGDVIDGQLKCSSCGLCFPIIGGIPRFVSLTQVEAAIAATAASFGWQWQHFTHEDERYAEQFLGWIAPVKPDFFRDKLVLEAGCGKGRHTQLASRWGAKEVIGVDLSNAVETAFAATRELENVHIIQADIFRLPLAPVFDYAFAVGVLHHLPDPRDGFISLASKVRPGGHISAWVYGAENNEWITRWISPVRERLTSRIDRRALLHLSKVPAALVYLSTKLFYGPLSRTSFGSRFGRWLFYNDYLSSIASFGWREQHSIVFDHLVAPTAFYISRQEFDRWWGDLGAEQVVVSWHNKNSWRGFGKLNDLRHPE